MSYTPDYVINNLNVITQSYYNINVTSGFARNDGGSLQEAVSMLFVDGGNINSSSLFITNNAGTIYSASLNNLGTERIILQAIFLKSGISSRGINYLLQSGSDIYAFGNLAFQNGPVYAAVKYNTIDKTFTGIPTFPGSGIVEGGDVSGSYVFVCGSITGSGFNGYAAINTTTLTASVVINTQAIPGGPPGDQSYWGHELYGGTPYVLKFNDSKSKLYIGGNFYESRIYSGVGILGSTNDCRALCIIEPSTLLQQVPTITRFTDPAVFPTAPLINRADIRDFVIQEGTPNDRLMIVGRNFGSNKKIRNIYYDKINDTFFDDDNAIKFNMSDTGYTIAEISTYKFLIGGGFLTCSQLTVGGVSKRTDGVCIIDTEAFPPTIYQIIDEKGNVGLPYSPYQNGIPLKVIVNPYNTSSFFVVGLFGSFKDEETAGGRDFLNMGYFNSNDFTISGSWTFDKFLNKVFPSETAMFFKKQKTSYLVQR